jgi:hypothetical protein
MRKVTTNGQRERRERERESKTTGERDTRREENLFSPKTREKNEEIAECRCPTFNLEI